MNRSYASPAENIGDPTIDHGTVTGIAITRSDPSDAVVTAITCVVPAVRPVIVPLASTVATLSFMDIQRLPGPAATDEAAKVAPVATVTAGAPTTLPVGVGGVVAVVLVVPDELGVVGVVAAGIRTGFDHDTWPDEEKKLLRTRRNFKNRGYVVEVGTT